MNLEISITGISLDHLKIPYGFPTKPEDGIKSVKIVRMKLEPYNKECGVILEVPRNCTRTIYQIIEDRLDHSGSILNSFAVKEVELFIEFGCKGIISATSTCLVAVTSSGSYKIEGGHESLTIVIAKCLKYWKLN